MKKEKIRMFFVALSVNTFLAMILGILVFALAPTPYMRDLHTIFGGMLFSIMLFVGGYIVAWSFGMGFPDRFKLVLF